MANRTLFRQFDLPEEELRQELGAAFDHEGVDWLPPEEQQFRDNRVVTGRVRKVSGDEGIGGRAPRHRLERGTRR